MRRFLLALLLAVVLFLQKPGLCWDELGHQVVAQIAWNNLRPKVRLKALDVLSHDPNAKYHDFIKASLYPDDIKRRDSGVPLGRQHRPWHYVNIPYKPEEQASKRLGGIPTKVSVINKIKDFTADLGAATDPVETQAEKLCWLIHLVGDLHQPLHSVAMFNATFPEGDAGGNGFTITSTKVGNKSVDNLHSFWDDVLGLKYDSDVEKIARNITTQHPRSEFRAEIRETAPEKWAYESAEFAAKYAYNHEGTMITKGIPKTSSQYRENTFEAARERVALAGYRLAALLNRLYPDQ
jgi:hypothetical protein